ITAAFAAVQITLTVPDVAVPIVLDAFNDLAGENIEISVHSDDFDGNWSYRYAPKDPNETQKQFAQRVIKEHVRAMVRLVESAKEYERYKTEINAIPPPDINIPDGIIE
ncbi:hypothetical protein LCGC14_2338360, partial [marine sediment metagenome]